jgi:CYTH domain-containing protein
MPEPAVRMVVAMKYARYECERRFLLTGLPDGPVARTVHITDRYIAGTRIRLRRMTGPDGVVFKLTQKIPGPPRLITTFYLDEDEYDVLSGLDAHVLEKTRYSMPPLGVDRFASGLWLAEAEFETETEMEAFVPPAFVVAEVTGDVRFTGGHLAGACDEDVRVAIADVSR